MRKVEKPASIQSIELTLTPKEQEKYEQDLERFLEGVEKYTNLVKQDGRKAMDKFNEDWYRASKQSLYELYKGKCAFCEEKFPSEDKATIEHYRPKNKYKYYWLGVEWTNLFPTCNGCNNPKGEVFETQKEKVKEPLNASGELDMRLFDAKVLHQIEEPYLLNPEIDEPKEFLAYNKNAKLEAIDNNERGIKTIELLDLNAGKEETKRETFFLKRKGVLDGIRETIERQTLRILRAKQMEEPTVLELSLAFDDAFEAIMRCAYDEMQKFTLLGYCMIADFDKLISQPISESLNTSEEVKTYINELIRKAFLRFLVDFFEFEK
jgi:uncharacterized protein (TIGR02646 family)